MQVGLSKIVEKGGRTFAAGGCDRNGVMVKRIIRVGNYVTVSMDPAVPGRGPRQIVKHVDDLCLMVPAVVKGGVL